MGHASYVSPIRPANGKYDRSGYDHSSLTGTIERDDRSR